VLGETAVTDRIQTRGKRNMTNEEAILRLARDVDDGTAMVALAENNENTLNAAIGRYFSAGAARDKARLTLLAYIARRTKYFLHGYEDADKWFADCADLECRRIRSELAAHAAQAASLN
jgi:hypothetical protein